VITLCDSRESVFPKIDFTLFEPLQIISFSFEIFLRKTLSLYFKTSIRVVLDRSTLDGRAAKR